MFIDDHGQWVVCPYDAQAKVWVEACDRPLCPADAGELLPFLIEDSYEDGGEVWQAT